MSTAYENLGTDLLLVDGDLGVASDGDLLLTPGGRTALLQDIAHLLETLPGDLFAHPDHGAGVERLFGESGRDLERRLARAIEDALNYSPAVAGRIVAGSARVTAADVTDREIEARVTCQAIVDGVVTPLTFVWGWGLDDVARIRFV